MPVASAADQGLSASEAPKPAIEREPEPAAPAQATASLAQSPAGTADGTSSALSTSVVATLWRSPDNSLDRATSPPPDGTPIVPVASAADQGLSASEAPKPAIEREPEPAAPAQATASLAQSPAGTADGASSTLSTPVAASPPPSQSAGYSLDRATSPPPDGMPIVPVASAEDQGLSVSEAPKPGIKREPKRKRAAHAQATASLLAQSPVGTADGASSTLSTPVAASPPPSQSAGYSLDRATSPPPDGMPIVPVASAEDQGLSVSEAPKPGIKREPKRKRAAHAQATASLLAQSPVGTADGASSTLSTPAAAPPPASQSPDNSLDRATSPWSNPDCGLWHDWNGRYTAMCGL